MQRDRMRNRNLGKLRRPDMFFHGPETRCHRLRVESRRIALFYWEMDFTE
jgi:hypothetical protein